MFLTREEAWQMYLNKLDEEANYFTVTEETEEEICTCTTCIVSRNILLWIILNSTLIKLYKNAFILQIVQ